MGNFAGCRQNHTFPLQPMHCVEDHVHCFSNAMYLQERPIGSEVTASRESVPSFFCHLPLSPRNSPIPSCKNAGFGAAAKKTEAAGEERRSSWWA